MVIDNNSLHHSSRAQSTNVKSISTKLSRGTCITYPHKNSESMSMHPLLGLPHAVAAVRPIVEESRMPVHDVHEDFPL